ncbi:MAG: delta-60 repeat domain-containing protein, partial [Planctomycetota bacterium]
MKHLMITFLLISCFFINKPVLASDGVLDTTFHSPDGYALWDGGSGYDRGRDIALQRDGKILVTGYMTNGADDDLMVIRFNIDGTLDTGFGTNGAYIYDGGDTDGGYAIAAQSDGKILVAGEYSNGSDGDVIVLRLDPDGSLDTNFGSNGIYTYDGGNGYDAVIDLLVQPDGKIVICGSTNNGTDNDLLVMRLNKDGALDTTFGTNGATTYHGGNNHDYGLRLTVQNDGKILVTGMNHNGSDNDIIVVRFNTNGAPDTSFGTGGIAIYDGGDYDRGYGVDTNSKGNILVTGIRTKPNQNSTDYDIPVICFDSNGILDTSFGNNGIVLYDGGISEQCFDLIVQNDDTILVAGYSGFNIDGTSEWSLVVLKYAQDGTLDTTFGTNGVYRYNPTDKTEWGYGLALQKDNKIVVVGQAHNGIDDDVIILRLTNNRDYSNDIPSLMWSQPPVEIDPNIQQEPVFCGYGEPAQSTQQNGLRRQWRMDADDFRCFGPMPITGIRWWGRYKGWTFSEPPELQPEAWHIGIWANQVEGVTQDESFPERMVWSLEIPAELIHFEPIGHIEFPQLLPIVCYLYEIQLEPEERFYPEAYESNDDIFWITVTAFYPADVEQKNTWGWLTRPHLWGNGAVMPAIMGDWPAYDERLFPERIYPIENSSLCGQDQPYDMCFELLTGQSFVKWDQPFTGLRDWPYSEAQESFAIENELGNLQVKSQVA